MCILASENLDNKIVLIGDSHVELFKSEYSETEFVNLGISGDTVKPMCIRLKTALKSNLKLIIIVIGINDVLKGTTPDHYSKKFKNLIKIINSNNERVRILQIFPVCGERSLFNCNISILNSYLELNINPKCFVKVGEFFCMRETHELKKDLTSDGLHLNSLGNYQLGKVFDRIVISSNTNSF